jgi:hypothetical protein
LRGDGESTNKAKMDEARGLKEKEVVEVVVRRSARRPEEDEWQD